LGLKAKSKKLEWPRVDLVLSWKSLVKDDCIKRWTTRHKKRKNVDKTSNSTQKLIPQETIGCQICHENMLHCYMLSPNFSIHVQDVISILHKQNPIDAVHSDIRSQSWKGFRYTCLI